MKTALAAYRPATRPLLAAPLLLMLPLLAMQVTDQVNWDLFDFAVAGALIVGTGLMFELAASKARNLTYRAAVGVALAAAFLLVWINIAVGIIGDEGNSANLMYVGVLAIGFVGAILARFRPEGLARALFATALAQALVGGIAVVFGLGSPGSGPLELLALNGFFAMLFVGSALLFREARRGEPEQGAV